MSEEQPGLLVHLPHSKENGYNYCTAYLQDYPLMQELNPPTSAKKKKKNVFNQVSEAGCHRNASFF